MGRDRRGARARSWHERADRNAKRSTFAPPPALTPVTAPTCPLQYGEPGNDTGVRLTRASIARAVASERYEIVRRIGSGAMGVVDEGFDRERAHAVALKTLTHLSPAALYAFRREFRSLADLSLKNVARLYDLGGTDEESFFTMELVEGVDLVTHVMAPDRDDASTDDELLPCGADIPRLRAALAQLVQGVQALHAAGKLHRDLKPSNVLVTADGRVVLLDYGVAADVPEAVDRQPEEEIASAHYIAPEQAAGDPATTATDWYAVGVLLYEALVGEPPFVGSPLEILTQKSTLEPTPPSARVGGVPPELDALCVELLESDPDLRPEGPEIARRVASGPSEPPVVSSLPSAGPSIIPLVGREPHLAALEAALATAARGQAVTVRVQGGSGMGKSALVHRFLDAAVEDGKAIALRGRAYERDAIPFKTLDAVMDALARLLLELPEPPPMPADIWALARLFPALRRVPAIAAETDPAIVDLPQVRSRAFSALRALLAHLGRSRPVALFVDDVQWGDADSAALLLDLVRPPAAPPVLLLLACREEDADESPLVRELRTRWPERAELRDVWVGPLSADEAMRLARSLVGTGEASIENLSTIASEAGGSAFLVEEMARGMSGRRLKAEAGTVTLERILADRLARIADAPRLILELVAVAGRPMPVVTVGHAAGIHEGIAPLVAMLRARRFVRTGLRDGHEVIETRHDRVRETIVAGLDAATTRARHASLARVLEAVPDADVEALVEHIVGAGEPSRAAAFAERAAEQATEKLAFVQAVRFYERAIGMSSTDADKRRLLLRLAEALDTAGHGAEAADAYLLAAQDGPPFRRAELQRAAAEQLLMSGHMDRGARVLAAVLAAWGMAVPRSPLAAVVELFFQRLRLWWMGLEFEERGPEDVPRETRARIDAVYAVAIGLSIVDVAVSACMQARNLVMALREGDTFQVMRAASLEASHLASRGGPESARERDLFALVQRLAGADASSDRRSERQAFFEGKSGIRHFLRGQWRRARDVLDEAHARYPNSRAGSHANAYLFSLYSLVFLGDFLELGRRHAHLLNDAVERGDLYTAVNLRAGYPNLVWLAADDPGAARRQAALARDAVASWGGTSGKRFLVQDWEVMLAEAHIELYAGDPARAYERVARDVATLAKSFLLEVQFLRACTDFLRARCAIALAASGRVDGHARVALVAEAADLHERLEREGMSWTRPLAAIVGAGVANLRGDPVRAMAYLRAAVDLALAADMALLAVAADLAIGRAMGGIERGGEGQRLETEARAWMAAQEIRDPDRMMAVLVPGRWGAPPPRRSGLPHGPQPSPQAEVKPSAF
jgi:hypothetical protein